MRPNPPLAGARPSLFGPGAVTLALFGALVLGVADVRADVAALGMAGAYSLRARGVDAPSWNPAVLAWHPALEIRLAAGRATVHNNSFTLDDYNRWNGAVWDDGDKEALLARIPGAFFEGRFDASADGPGFAWRGWALTTEAYAAGFAELPKEFARLVLYGNDPEESFQLDGTDGDGLAWSEYRVSYAREVARIRGDRLGLGPVEIAAGASFKLLQGLACGETMQATGGLETTLNGISGDAELVARTAEGGWGAAVDLGVAARTASGWRFAAGARNVYSSIAWSRRPTERIERAWADSVTIEELDDGDDDLVETESLESTIPGFRRSIPAQLTLAAGRPWAGNWVEADLAFGLESRAGTSHNPRLAIGMSRGIVSWLDGRVGLAAGGADGPVFAAGAGLGLWKVRLDVGAAAVSGWNLFDPKGVAAGASLGLRWSPGF